MKTSPPLTRATSLLRQFLADERGMIVSAELMITMTVGVLALVTGVSAVSSALNFEYTDIANALTSLDQSYNVSGQFAGSGRSGGGSAGGGVTAGGGYHAFNRGMGFNDGGNTFVAQAREATVAGSAYVSEGGSISVNATAATTAVVGGQAQAFALVEESGLLVEEIVDAQAVTEVETEAELEQRLMLLEAEAARLEAEAAARTQVTAQGTQVCPLDELKDLEARLRRLRQRLENQKVFDCDAR